MSTDYTHFDKLAFNRLFAFGPDGTETLIINSSGTFVGPISSTGTEIVNKIFTGAGTVSAPSHSFTLDTNTGFYNPSSDTLRITTGGSDSADFASGQVRLQNGLVSAPSLAGVNFQTTGIFWQAGPKLSATVSTQAIWTATTTGLQMDSGVFYNQDGSVGSPGITFINDSDTGFYRIGSNDFAATAGGAKVAEFSTTGLAVTKAISASNFSGTSSGTNTGDQTISLTGPVTGSGVGTFATTLSNSAVSNVHVAAAAAISGSKIVSASSSAAGVITTGTQSFAGTKTFVTPLTGSNVASASSSASGVITTGAQSLAGVKTFTSAITASAGISGTSTNNNAATGIVGEVLSASTARTAALNIATATSVNITSLTLTAGDWDVSCSASFLPSATTTVQTLRLGLSTTTATLPPISTTAVSDSTGQIEAVNQYVNTFVPGNNDMTMQLRTVRVSLSGSVTYYLVGRVAIGVATMSTYGSIFARRIR